MAPEAAKAQVNRCPAEINLIASGQANNVPPPQPSGLALKITLVGAHSQTKSVNGPWPVR
jgi:hypothetical protein